MKLGFRFRMMLAILIVAFVCIIAVSLTNYYDSKYMIEQNYVTSLDDKIAVQTERFDETMQEMYQTVRHISSRPELAERIQNYLDGGREYTDCVRLSQQLSAMLTFKRLDSALYFYLPETGQVFSSMEYYAVRQMEKGTVPFWAEHSEKNPFTPLFFINRTARASQRVYAYALPVYQSSGEKLGMLCIAVDERQLYYELLDPLNNASGENYRMLSPDSIVCSAEQLSEIGKAVPGMDETHSDRMNADTADGDRLFASVEAPFSKYRLLCQSDLTLLTRELRGRQMILLAYTFVFFLCMLFAAAQLSKQLSRPLEGLIHAIDQVRGGDFTARAHSMQTDEFDALTDHFNDMVSRMDELMEEVVLERTQKKQAELNALQYQIRPHFMYNTLNSIRFAATMQRNQKLAELLGSFISLLEASSQRRGAFLTLREEMQLVKDYISLQKFRYFDCFETIYRIEPEAEDCYVPCLLLQPMVENAVFHGIDTKRTDNVIEISAWTEGGNLYITVSDNGDGIPEDGQHSAMEDKRRLTGIGLRNVDQRLRLYYGDSEHFVISSRPGEGTTVTFTIPVSHDPEEYSIEKGVQQ